MAVTITHTHTQLLWLYRHWHPKLVTAFGTSS